MAPFTAVAPARSNTPRVRSAAQMGLPDPRPVTTYSVAVTNIAGNDRITITLTQPCVIRAPRWGIINCDTGTVQTLPVPTIVDNRTFYYTVTGALNPAVGFIEVPYMDTQVQNFQGGFVKPGGQWFRAPVGP